MYIRIEKELRTFDATVDAQGTQGSSDTDTIHQIVSYASVRHNDEYYFQALQFRSVAQIMPSNLILHRYHSGNSS